MKKWGPAIALVCVAGALLFFLLNSHAPSSAPIAPAEQRAASSAGGSKTSNPPTPGTGNTNPTAVSAARPQFALPTPMSAVAAKPVRPAAIPHPLEFTNLPPATVLDNMRITFHQYASMFGGNPVGTNPEITAALNGKNPKQANFIQPEAGMRIDDKGELVDPWGTPYFFHQLSGTDMEIHSAGPDRIMWTADDLVVK
jgi:hypothetical protein